MKCTFCNSTILVDRQGVQSVGILVDVRTEDRRFIGFTLIKIPADKLEALQQDCFVALRENDEANKCTRS